MAFRLGRVEPAHAAHQPGLLGLHVGGRHQVQPAVLVDEVDLAPVGDAGDDQAGELVERGLDVQRAREEAARLAQELEALIGAARRAQERAA